MGRAQFLRTARHHAGYFLPYLRPGMDLIDVGCGPGSISMELARLLSPGRVVGVDLGSATLPESIERDATEARFVRADVGRLPFADASFDAAHSHALFQHLADPLAALRELRRVLRPGGVIGVADWDREMTIVHPCNDALQRSSAWLGALRRRAGGDPQAGRRLAERLALSGFERPAMSAVANGVASRRAAREQGERMAATFENERTREALIEAGIASTSELDELATRWRAWSREPGAFVLTLWFSAVAYR